MSVLLDVEHRTAYRYARPVRFGQHRLMFRPRANHNLQVVSAEVEVSPRARIGWMLDVQSNSVTLIEPEAESAELSIAARFTVRHHGGQAALERVAPHASRWPFDYSPDERRDLGALLEPHCPDPEGRLHEWLRPFFSEARPHTRELLLAIARAIKQQMVYETRVSEGTQNPDLTLARGAGSCRDFAWLMIEACRRLGLAARFVSGYLYDPALDAGDGNPDNDGAVLGAGATHAWLEVYLPGAGWSSFDPTNALTGGVSLIHVAHAREPRFAAPLLGTWYGDADDFLGLEVKVEVRRRSELP